MTNTQTAELSSGMVPMRYAVLSDVHGRHEKLAGVLTDIRSRGVQWITSLGDVGGDHCLTLPAATKHDCPNMFGILAHARCRGCNQVRVIIVLVVFMRAQILNLMPK